MSKATTSKAKPKSKPATAPKIGASDILASPVLFGQVVLGFKLYPWQINVLTDCEYILANQELRPNSISLLACNGSGKTSVTVATLVLWAMTAYKNALVVVTSGAFRQVSKQLFPNLQKFSNKFKDWQFNAVEVLAPNGSKAIGFSASDEGKAEGFHAIDHKDSPLIYIVDEAKTVDDKIFTAVDRCQPTLKIYVSSSGGRVGAFYRSHTTEKSNFYTHKVAVEDCPHIDQARINDIIDKYGEDHPFTRSTLYSEFMGEEGNVVISSIVLDGCYASGLIANRDPEIHAFCDFAAGGDENILALRKGNKVTIEDSWTDVDTMRAVGRFIQNFNRLKLKPEHISVDDGGVGHAIADRMAELGWNVNRINNGSKSSNPSIWANKGTEIWDKGRQLIEDRKIILPEDSTLQEQLINRLWDNSSDGKLKLESKDSLKRRGGHSPDRADAVLGAMMPSPKNLIQIKDYTYQDIDNSNYEEDISDQLSELGILV